MDMSNNPKTENRVIRVGPFYAVNELFRTIDASWDFHYNSDETWEEYLHRAYRTRFTPNVIDEIRHRIFNDPTAKSLLCLEEAHGRRLGKSTVQFTSTRILNDRFLCVNGVRKNMENEVMVVRHERSTISPTKCDNISVISHLAINRHAIERIYERDDCPAGGLLADLQSDLVEAERYAAFAFASDLYIGNGRRQPGAATAIPYRDGLLFIRNYIVALRPKQSPSSRTKISRSGLEGRRILASPEQTVPLPPYQGTPIIGYIVPVATTYVPERMLRLEQQAYVANFREAADQYNLAAISHEAAFSGIHHHQRNCKPLSIEIDPRLRLHYLLGISARLSDPKEVWLAIGWDGDDHPDLWAHPAPRKAA